MSDPVVRREEVESALAARHELGREYEPEIVDNLVERIERRLEARRPAGPLARRQEEHRSVTPLALGSIALGIPVTAISLGNHSAGGIAVAIVAWIAIAIVNLAWVTYALRR